MTAYEDALIEVSRSQRAALGSLQPRPLPPAWQEKRT